MFASSALVIPGRPLMILNILSIVLFGVSELVSELVPKLSRFSHPSCTGIVTRNASLSSSVSKTTLCGLFYYFPVAAFIRSDAANQATSFHLFQLVVNPISSYATYCSKFFISQRQIILDSIKNNFSSLIYLFLRSFLGSFLGSIIFSQITFKSL